MVMYLANSAHRRGYSRVSHIKNHILSLRSNPVSYRMRLVSRECSSVLFAELPSVIQNVAVNHQQIIS